MRTSVSWIIEIFYKSFFYIPTHQNSKLLLMSRYMTVFHILFWF